MNENNENISKNEQENTEKPIQNDAVNEKASGIETSAAEQRTNKEFEEAYISKEPKKRFTAFQTVVISAISVILTFMITFLAVTNAKDAQFRDTVGKLDSSVLGVQITDEQRLRLYSLLLELDTRFSQYEFNEIDYVALTDAVLTAYAEAVGDDYSEYYNEAAFEAMLSSMQGQNQGIGVNIVYDAEANAISVVNVMPNSPAFENGILPGDLIVAVGTGDNKENVADLGYTAAVLKLQGLKGTSAEFTVLRDGKMLEFSIMREEYENQSVLWHLYAPDNSIAVVKILNFDGLTFDQFKTAMDEIDGKGIKKVVFDVRANPGGNLTAIVDVLDLLLPKGPIIRIVDKTGKVVEQMDSDAEASYTDMKFAVLANENTASAAELFTSALMDYERATMVGTVTFGKGSMQSTFTLTNGTTGVKMTTYHYLPPYSDSYDGIGIVPHISVELKEELKNKNLFLISDEEDNQLTAAVEALNK